MENLTQESGVSVRTFKKLHETGSECPVSGLLGFSVLFKTITQPVDGTRQVMNGGTVGDSSRHYDCIFTGGRGGSREHPLGPLVSKPSRSRSHSGRNKDAEEDSNLYPCR